MKRIGFLYDKIIDKDNIKLAIIKASKGKTKRRDVRYYLENIEQVSDKIHTLLKNKSYKFVKGNIKIIKETKKERKITVPKFRDIVVQYAIINVIKPIIMKGMYKYSCGNINNRGSLYAKKYVEIVVKKYQPKYCLKLDIKKFYHNIDSNILIELLKRKIKDKDTIALLSDIINVGVDSETLKGLPIGYYTSQWLSNFYLQEIDHLIKETLKVKYYVRYVDDMCLFGNNKRELHKIFSVIQEQLWVNLRLRVKENYQIFPLSKRDIDFVGYKINYKHIRIRKRTLKLIKRRKRKILNNENNIFISKSFMSYVGWLKHIKRNILDKGLLKAISIAKGYISKIDKKEKSYSYV